MMKSGTTVVIVESVDKAVKFYTERLAFDIVEIIIEKNELGQEAINYAHLRKGKCFIMFRSPEIEELAEFSFIKRCASRCVGIFAEMKKGIEKYYEKCNKKGLLITDTLKDTNWGYKTFSIKDPFGLRITFAQKLENYQKPTSFLTSGINKNEFAAGKEQSKVAIEKMVKYLKTYSILRRAAKKYAKNWIKLQTKK